MGGWVYALRSQLMRLTRVQVVAAGSAEDAWDDSDDDNGAFPRTRIPVAATARPLPPLPGPPPTAPMQEEQEEEEGSPVAVRSLGPRRPPSSHRDFVIYDDAN
jgi:hypothetical protein